MPEKFSPKKTEKVTKKKLTIAVDKIDSPIMKKIDTGDHKISIVAPKMEKRTFKERIRQGKALVNGSVSKVKQSTRTKFKEITSRVDEIADNILSLVELATIDPKSAIDQQEEVNNVIKQADKTQLPWILKKLLAWSQKTPLLGSVIQKIENETTKQISEQQEEDYGLDDRPVVKNEEIGEDDWLWPN